MEQGTTPSMRTKRPAGSITDYDPVRGRLQVLLLTLVAVIVAGTFSFSQLEKRSLMDAFYFTAATISTVGYGDVAPVTTAGRLLAILLIVLGVGSFLGVIANATELMLHKRERRILMLKLNMVIGVFFSEVGTGLLASLSGAARWMDAIRSELRVDGEWSDARFETARCRLSGLEGRAEDWNLDLPALRSFLLAKREFMLRLLENPALLEHQTFTDLLRAVFHLTEELACRSDITRLPESDRLHLAGDAQRALLLLLDEWLSYMQHLKVHYPYLFSLEARMNPFRPDASPIVT